MNIPLIPEPAASAAAPSARPALPPAESLAVGSTATMDGLSPEARACWRTVRSVLRWAAAGVLALLLLLWLAGCAAFPVTAKLVTPYGTLTRTAGGKTVIEVHAERLNSTWGFAK